eukprot:1158172-Pelagomonas_calceolata.AAC.3
MAENLYLTDHWCGAVGDWVRRFGVEKVGFTPRLMWQLSLNLLLKKPIVLQKENRLSKESKPENSISGDIYTGSMQKNRQLQASDNPLCRDGYKTASRPNRAHAIFLVILNACGIPNCLVRAGHTMEHTKSKNGPIGAVT